MEPLPANQLSGFTEGRIVHFVLPNGEHRPAMIVRAWNPGVSCLGYANLQVFTDGSNDVSAFQMPQSPEFEEKRKAIIGGMTWETSVCYDETGKIPRTWHWVEPA